jgi:amino acid transporter
VLGAIGIIALLYIAVQLVSQGILGTALAGAKTPLADAAGVALGGWGRTLILVGSSVSMFGYVSGMTLAVPRMLFAFARDGFLPRSVAAVHPRFRTPFVAIAIQATLVAILAVSGSFERLALVANGSVLLVYAACCVATFDLRRRDVRAGGVPFRVPAAGLVPWLALGVIVALLATLQKLEWAAVLATVLVAAIVYLIGRTRREAMIAQSVGSR